MTGESLGGGGGTFLAQLHQHRYERLQSRRIRLKFAPGEQGRDRAARESRTLAQLPSGGVFVSLASLQGRERGAAEAKRRIPASASSGSLRSAKSDAHVTTGLVGRAPALCTQQANVKEE